MFSILDKQNKIAYIILATNSGKSTCFLRQKYYDLQKTDYGKSSAGSPCKSHTR